MKTSQQPTRNLVWVLVLASLAPATALAADGPTAADLPPAQRQKIDDLIQAMTLAEKLGQLTQVWAGEFQGVNPDAKAQQESEYETLIRNGQVGSFLGTTGAERTNRFQRVAVTESRLGIPLIFGNDVIHGYRTICPIPLAQASTWQPELVEQAAHVAAVEARAAGTHWTFAPMIDIARDPRWGRVAEGAGEDPFLGAALAAAQVRGYQGANLTAPDAVLACAKHFVAYGGAEAGRDYNTVDISPQTLHEIYLPPFQAAVDAGVGSIMTAFNEINGVPCSANRHLLRDVLRDEWGFRGFVVSDWGTIGELVEHGVAENERQAAALAILAGLDMDMSSLSYRKFLAESVAAGEVPMAVVDQAVRNVLIAKARLGLFDNPYTDPEREASATLTAAHRAIARDVARHAIVLLKNEHKLLPIRPDVASIAVIGPLADNQKDPLGTWAALGRAEDVVSVLTGIRNRAPQSMTVQYTKGSDILVGSDADLAEAVALAKQCALAVLVVGESADMSGEAHCRTSLDIPEPQRKLIRSVYETGVPTVVVTMSGRPLSIQWTAEHIPAILQTWDLGVECGNAIADVLFGDFNPGGKLPVTVPRTVGQVPIYYNHKHTGRPPDVDDPHTSKYIDVDFTPLYPFGYGLSYTDFEFTNLQVTPQEIDPQGSVTVTVDVTNVGERTGDEVVQLYVRDVVGSLTRPVKQLKGFRRITLAPGAHETVSFQLGSKELGFYNATMEYVVEPGAFQLWVGPDSEHGPAGAFKIVR